MARQLSDKGVTKKSSRLSGSRIAFAVCAGIGAVEVVKIIRELRRHGAEVFPFVTPSVEKFIGVVPLKWASGNPVVQEADADVEHLEDYDLVIVAPATLNTLAKASVGIADNAVTLLMAGQFGAKRPLLIYPTMNDRLREHPRYPEMLKQLSAWGAHFPEPVEEEGRLKMPAPDRVAEAAAEVLG